MILFGPDVFSRDENPVGEWTIRVSDQAKENENGTFLGWTMSIWGSVADPSKPVRAYDVPLVEGVLPPVSTEDDTPTSTIPVPPTSTSKTLTKPTAHLPGDHGDAEGEKDKPAFPGATPVDDSETTPSSSQTAVPTVDEGWFSDLSSLLSNQVWVFVALGAVALFAISAGLFFWRRAARRRANYSTLPADDLAMSSLLPGSTQRTQRGPRTKELYDAFGEVSDDDEVDEMTGLRHSPEGDGFHSAFLDDDDPTTGGTPHYKDEPDRPEARDRPSSRASGSGSADGSWEHASR